MVPAQVPRAWKALDGFKLEADASESGVVRSASLSLAAEEGLIKRVAAGATPIGALLTHEQAQLLEAVWCLRAATP